MSESYDRALLTAEAASYRYDEALSVESLLLEELLKSGEIQQLFEAYFNLTNIPTGIIDVRGNVLVASPWHRICAKFHRVHPATCARCIESDTNLASRLKSRELYTIYTCLNGLKECVAPIIIDGKHVANLFIGQFFTAEPDIAFFRNQAKTFGFEADDYLAALNEVPVIEEAKVPVIVELVLKTTRSITKLASESKRAIDNEARQSAILNTIPQSVFWKDKEGKYLGCNSAFAKSAGFNSSDEIIGKTDYELPWTRQEAEAYRADDAVVIALKQPKMHIVEHVQQVNGIEMTVDTSKIPLVDANSNIYGVVGIFEDITKRIEAERELKRYRESLENMVQVRTEELQREIKERKDIEERLRESEIKYRSMIDQSSTIVLEWDTQGNVLYLNPYGLNFFGFRSDEIIGKNVLGTIVPTFDSSGANLEEKMLKVQCEPDGFYSSENENLRKNGEKVWIAWSNRGVYNTDGKLIKTVSYGIDRTEQKRVEEKLYSQYKMLQEEIAKRKEVEAHLRASHVELENRVLERTAELSVEKALSDAVINSLPGVFYMFNCSGRLIRCNDEFARLAEVKAESDESHQILSRMVEGDRKKANIAIEQAFREGKAELEASIMTINGVRLFHLIAQRLQIENDTYIVGSGYDITDKKHAEEKLRDSETRFRSVFMTGALAFVIVEMETGKILEVNEKFLELYKYAREEVIGYTSLELGMWATPESRQILLKEVQKDGRVENFEVLAQRRDGKRFWVLYSVNTLYVQGTRLMVGTILDITERKDAENKVQEYAKQLEETLTSTLRAVSAMVELRDPYTAGHEQRVGLIAADIAREMGWSEEKCNQLAMIGLVHDIGKIAIPSEILTKPGKLSALEYEMVKTHAERGFEILKNVKSPIPIAEIIREHHERIDGSGYPHGLKGEQIMMEAKILAVADVLESMASHRPYRPALGISAALIEIESHKGTFYDENVVDAVLRLIKENGYQLPQ